jgi:hypothetical protein
MKWIIGIGILVAGGGGVGAWQYMLHTHEPAQVVAFINAYAEYAEYAQVLETLTTAPGSGGNEARQQLHQQLTIALSADRTSIERLQAAREARTALATIRQAVDNAQSSSARLYTLIDALEEVAHRLVDVQNAQDAAYIVAQVRSRQESSARIASVLSATNDTTDGIVSEIIASEGNLTNEHILRINAVTNDAEQRYETVADEVRSLQQIRTELERAFQTFVTRAL